jgi:accessory colonization factor AcfC
MRQGPADIFYCKAKRNKDIIFSEISQISTDGFCSAIKETVSQILYSQQAILVKGFIANPEDHVSSKANDTVLFSNSEILFIVI